MKSKISCSRCKRLGHNRWTCTNEPVEKKPKGKKGRLMKSNEKNDVVTSSTTNEEIEIPRLGYPRGGVNWILKTSK